MKRIQRSILLAVSILLIFCLFACAKVEIDESGSPNTADSPPPEQTDNPAPSDDSAQELLREISDTAKLGKVINCDFAVDTTVIEDVEAQWGEPDSADYVQSAKGTYYTFSGYDVVFGCNKGEQVFEVRYMGAKLAGITYADVEAFFGVANDTSTTAEGQEILGYQITDDLMLEFVFDGTDTSSTLNHYMVIKPALTENSMADDPGRDW